MTSPAKLKPNQEFITPDDARIGLGENITNRNMRKHRVDEIADDMLNGRYDSDSPNNGIMYDTKGELLDGQHRLSAIVRAQQIDENFPGIVHYVYRNVPATVRPVIDIGSPRTLGDILNMEGHKNAAPTVAAASQIVLNFLTGERLNANRSKKEKHDFIHANPQLFYYGALATEARTAGRPAALAAVIFLGTRAAAREGEGGELDDHAVRFIQGVANGAELSVGDPRLSLRDALYRSRGAGDRGKLSYAVAATAYAWNAFVANLEQPQIRVTTGEDGDFVVPPILGAPTRGAGADKVNAGQLPPKARELVNEQRNRWATQHAAAE